MKFLMKFLLKPLKRFWIWFSRIAKSLFMVLLLLGIAVVSFYWVLWQIEGPNVSLRGGIVPGVVVMLGLIGIISGIFVRYMFGNQPIKRVLKGSAIGFFAAAIKVASIAVICAGIAVAAFNPVSDTQLHIVFDDYSSLATEYRVELLKQAASIVKVNKERDIKFDNAEIKEIVKDAAKGSEVTKLSSRLLTQVEKLEPLNQRFESLKKNELLNRSGDAVYVLSSHRDPNANVEGWPFDPTRIYSVWHNVNPNKDHKAAERPRILMYLIYHEPTIKPLLQIELEVPSEFQPENYSKIKLPYPNLKLKVFEKGKSVWKYTAKPPQRNEHQKFIKPSLIDHASFGHYGDRISYKIQLPMNGNEMTIEFHDNKGIWKPEAEYMPKFGGKRFPLPPRSLEVVFLGPKKQREVLERLPSLVPTKEASKAPPLRFITKEQAQSQPSDDKKIKTIIQMKMGEVTENEKKAIGKVVNNKRMAMVEVIEAEMSQNANLKRTPHYHAQPHGIVWNDFEQFPMLQDHAEMATEENQVVFVNVTNQEHTIPILYQKDKDNPGHVTIVIPKFDELLKLELDQQKAVAHLLVWATSLARRFGESEPLVATYEFTPSVADIIMLPTEAGLQDKGSVLNEFSNALFGALDEQVPNKWDNSIDREVLIYSLWGLVVLVALTVPMSLFSLWHFLKPA